MLKRLTPCTIVSPEDLQPVLEAVAEQGYAISDQECMLNCRCIVVPVRNARQKAVAAVRISSTLENFCEKKMRRLLTKLLTTAEMIGRETLARLKAGEPQLSSSVAQQRS